MAAPPLGGSPTEPHRPCEDRLAEAREEVLGLAEVARDVDLETHGTPMTWPQNTPPNQRPEEFPALARRLFDQCGVDVDVVNIDCSEPPCLIVGRRSEGPFSDSDPWYQALKGCQAWNDTFPGGHSLSTKGIPCPDGPTEGFLLFAPAPTWLLDGASEEDRANFLKRFDARSANAEDAWACE